MNLHNKLLISSLFALGTLFASETNDLSVPPISDLVDPFTAEEEINPTVQPMKTQEKEGYSWFRPCIAIATSIGLGTLGVISARFFTEIGIDQLTLLLKEKKLKWLTQMLWRQKSL